MKSFSTLKQAVRPKAALRFRIRVGAITKTLHEASTVALAVTDVQKGYGRLVELVEAGEGIGNGWSVIVNFASQEIFLMPLEFAEAAKQVRSALLVVRFVRYMVISYGQSIEIREFCPPHQSHRYALIEGRGAGVLELPGWIGEEVTSDWQTDAYVIALEECRRRWKL